jgi:hypothetical protein
MSMRARWLCCLILAGMAALPAEARRLALVIGNDGYQQLQRLERAGNDAETLAGVLKASGFEVTLTRDVVQRDMRSAFESFQAKLQAGDEAVVYYAGHGVQTARGALLLPIDIGGETSAQIEQTAYPLNQLIAELDRVKLRFSLVIIDACRDNPLQSQARSIGPARGLESPGAARNQLLVLSAGPNQASLDALHEADRHPNSLFARELSARLGKPGRSIASVANEVRTAVERAASAVRREQRPQLAYDAAAESWYFASTAAPGTITTVATLPGTPPTPSPSAAVPLPAAAPVPVPPVVPSTASERQYRAYALANGDRYEGDTVGAVRTGNGRYTFANGDVYEGGFLDNQHHGHGVEMLSTGDRYEGDHVNGVRQGRGIYRYANGDRYEGSFIQGMSDGLGRLSQANGDRYDGEFRNGLKHGRGVHFFANADRYEGSFLNGAQHGAGTHFYANGDRYVGEFADGVRHGRGVYHFVGGESRPMSFVNGVERAP